MSQVKQGAAQIVEGLTGSADGVEKLKGQTQKLTKALFRLLGDSDPAVSKSALVSLVNLSQDPAVAEALLDLNVVGRVMVSHPLLLCACAITHTRAHARTHACTHTALVASCLSAPCLLLPPPAPS